MGTTSPTRAAIGEPDFPSDSRFSRAGQASPGDTQGSTPDRGSGVGVLVPVEQEVIGRWYHESMELGEGR